MDFQAEIRLTLMRSRDTGERSDDGGIDSQNNNNNRKKEKEERHKQQSTTGQQQQKQPLYYSIRCTLDQSKLRLDQDSEENPPDVVPEFEIDGRAVSRAEVRNLAGELQIQTDNLCQFLPQREIWQQKWS